ncbi:MAG TPA: hypothetical protein VMV09_02235 [Candidatus Saccharimonadales bacterium]|nr:hypothetical protein [Candidatus Saccharimonadales bacterium]
MPDDDLEELIRDDQMTSGMPGSPSGGGAEETDEERVERRIRQVREKYFTDVQAKPGGTIPSVGSGSPSAGTQRNSEFPVAGFGAGRRGFLGFLTPVHNWQASVVRTVALKALEWTADRLTKKWPQRPARSDLRAQAAQAYLDELKEKELKYGPGAVSAEQLERAKEEQQREAGRLLRKEIAATPPGRVLKWGCVALLLLTVVPPVVAWLAAMSATGRLLLVEIGVPLVLVVGLLHIRSRANRLEKLTGQRTRYGDFERSTDRLAEDAARRAINRNLESATDVDTAQSAEPSP